MKRKQAGKGRIEFFDELMDGIPDVIYFKDKQGRLLMVNQAHAKGLGLKPEQVVGKTDFDIFGSKRAQRMAKDDEYVIRTGKPIIDKIERATRADGIDNYVSTTKIPRYDKKGRVIGLIGITRDITRRRQLEQFREEKKSFEKKLKELEGLNKIKSEFVSVVSHEIRTPLAITMEAVSLIIDGTTGNISAEQQDLLNKADVNLRRLRLIIDELFDLSKIERGVFKLNCSSAGINALIKDCVQAFKHPAEENGIELRYILPDKEVSLFIDAEKIIQVVSNLISNAVKFTEQGGSIVVRVDTLADKVKVEVSDTGVGIAKNDLDRIFDKFVQVSGLNSAGRKGLGLGLSIVREIIKQHSGEIGVESVLGVGSKFYFTLPRFYTRTDVVRIKNDE